jgi:hypothetical protein
MSEVNELERRIQNVENDVMKLNEKTRCIDVWQAENGQKISNILVNLGEVKEALKGLTSRPAKRWEGFIMAIIGAGAATFIGYIMSMLK